MTIYLRCCYSLCIIRPNIWNIIFYFMRDLMRHLGCHSFIRPNSSVNISISLYLRRPRRFGSEKIPKMIPVQGWSLLPPIHILPNTRVWKSKIFTQTLKQIIFNKIKHLSAVGDVFGIYECFYYFTLLAFWIFLTASIISRMGDQIDHGPTQNSAWSAWSSILAKAGLSQNNWVNSLIFSHSPKSAVISPY